MNSSVISISSNRIYLDTLSEAARQSLMHTISCYNRAKEVLYNFEYNNKILQQESDIKETVFIKQWLYDNFQIRPQEYYITSLTGQVSGMIRSQQELQKIYDMDLQYRQEKRQSKINKTFKQLRQMMNLKQKIIKLYKTDKAGRNQLALPKYLCKMFPDTKDLKQLYELELFVDKQIKRLSARISMMQWKQEYELSVHKTIPSRNTFGGGKAFYRTKDTTNIEINKWHEQRDFNRNRSVSFAGRYDAKYKNWLCKYDIQNHTMDITLMNGDILHLPYIIFPYREDNLRQVLQHTKESGYSIGYTLELRKDHMDRTFILMKAAFRIYDNHQNLDTSNGVISVDINYDNISWSELNSQGARLRGCSIYFNLDKKTTGQRKDILGRACSRIIRICEDTKKPLVMEDISLKKKKAAMIYDDKQANRKISVFAYQMISMLLCGKAFQKSVGVIKINPAYTSQIGKMKYMRQMKSTVHLAASYVIGRRGMRFSEKIPTYAKELISENKKRSHHWKQYSHLTTVFKKFKTDFFLTDIPIIHDIKEYFHSKFFYS